MLINPMAAQKLKAATAYGDYPDTTHAQRNELSRIFREEAGKLLDQQAESLIKRAVEQYTREEISYERYLELIEDVSKEEEARGATYGRQYARNRVFEFAEKRLDQARNQAYTLSLTEANVV